jgi:hypothetical protein
MNFPRLMFVAASCAIGAITAGFGHVLNMTVYPPPLQLLRQSHEIRRQQKQRPHRFAPNMNASLTLSPNGNRSRLDAPAEILITIQNEGPLPFYFTTQRHPAISVDTSPHNFRIMIEKTPKNCFLFYTNADTFRRPTERDLIASGKILLLMPNERRTLKTNLGKWRDLVCAPGHYRLRVVYDGIGIHGFSHPFLTLALASQWVELTIEN